ncbi:MAG: hypothetical protein GYA14_11915 [Ignavibacteria bacterium]|nr:hypothetical protein [Ignavibacteria bacterium]
MSLVPIIYTSLALFFGILFIVVMISYLSFKARKNANPVIVEEIRKQKRLNTPPAVIVKRVENVQFNQTRKIDVNAKINLPVESSPVVLPYDYFQKEQDIKLNQSRVAERSVKINYERKRNTSTYNNMGTRTRIEIMNETKQFKKHDDNKITKKESLAKYINDLSQFNILSFYSDNNFEKDFVTASAVPNQHPM